MTQLTSGAPRVDERSIERQNMTLLRSRLTSTLASAGLVGVLLVATAIASSCGAGLPHPPGGRFLVYTRDLSSSKQAVWIARTDGTHRRLLVRGIFGALSPDGRWVAYNRCLASFERCQRGNAPFALFLIGTSGGKSRLLARATSYPSWSPHSDRILALRKNTLVSLDLDGNLRVLEKSPATAGWGFSPDGRWVVYAKARQHTKCASDLFIVRASGGEERRLTRGRDIFPVWGRRWIAFSRYPKSCAFARRIWRVHPDGSSEQPVTAPPPPRLANNGYYGLDPIEWTPGERMLLAGLASEWGAEAIRVDVATGAFRKLSGYALDLSRDGRFALVDSGGTEVPHEIAAVSIADGNRRVLAHGDVAFPSWNR
jgi:Tol biopolymer transport system component